MIDCKPLIVVVHENRDALEALERLLSEHGCLVATFTSAFRSVDYAGRNKPDLILAQEPDEKSKGMEYLETIKKISPSTEAIFLPNPLHLTSPEQVRRRQADEILRIVDRLLVIAVLPEPRRAPQSRRLVV